MSFFGDSQKEGDLDGLQSRGIRGESGASANPFPARSGGEGGAKKGRPSAIPQSNFTLLEVIFPVPSPAEKPAGGGRTWRGFLSFRNCVKEKAQRNCFNQRTL